ncbi:PLP-dependent aminotransferase family protein [Lichenihabitans sp. Uapishka_5]|uniref:aminotransferase-like domain-containing protein n=1 Tax=Lichenihabitans sp. Uapishka_5 TaxID=3037302 RepID=UPI0029E804CF|nr:PLP-dependent aminotransferase family protein [Lichenihabitans sp. Uapishka_5]MDX7950510.1 PLP-dependent aminotransferase family protein [Lichenihabitans sp. Uapishka_5]
MPDWTPDLDPSSKPRYIAIADAIAIDIGSGRLTAADRLPPQRKLAARLGLDFTTVARGYVEAQRRGLIVSKVGQGTCVSPTAPTARPVPIAGPQAPITDPSMNLPPEPDDPALLARMRAGIEAVSADIVGLLRYQGFGGAPADKAAAANWLSRRALVPAQERVFVVPGAHAALLGILGHLAKPGDTVLSEAITYPGVRAIAAQLGVTLQGLPMDRDGIDPDAFAAACHDGSPKALYLNPTLQNPTTLTIPKERRDAIASTARHFGVPIVEDDAYGFIPLKSPPPFAALAPDLTWHIAGLAKCIGAGLRTAYTLVPDSRSGWPFAAALRASTVMASPFTAAIATRWITDGTADAILRFIRTETTARQALAAEILPAGSFRADPMSFNLWVALPAPWTRSAFVGQMRTTGLGVVASDAFTVSGPPAEAVRVCLGGPINRDGLRRGLEFMAHALSEAPEFVSHFF